MIKRYPAASADQIQAAKEAIAILGGSAMTAAAINDLGRETVTRHQVIKWRHRGVSERNVLSVSLLSRVPASRLNPHIYPEELVAVRKLTKKLRRHVNKNAQETRWQNAHGIRGIQPIICKKP